MVVQDQQRSWDAYHAGCRSAVWFDVSDRTELVLTGSDRQSFLHGFSTNDIKRLSPGTGCEAFVTTIKGRTLGHIFVFAETDRLVLDSVPNAAAVLMPHLDRYIITEDVELHDNQPQRAAFFVTGPEAIAAVSQLLGGDGSLSPDEFEIGHTKLVERDGIAITIRRNDWFERPGLLISVPLTNRDDLLNRLENSDLMVAGDESAWQFLRIKSRFPLHGMDFSEDNLVQEVNRTERAVSFNKGCYLGQEPVARIDALGHVNKMICGLELSDWPGSLETLTGANLFAVDNLDKPIGVISSAASLPTIAGQAEPIVALAMLRREFATHLQQIQVSAGDQRATAIVMLK